MVIAVRKNVQCTIVGDGFVGKSCLVKNFVTGEFQRDYVATLKDSYRKKSLVNGDNYELNINDVAGEYDVMSQQEIPNVYIVCFSVVDRDSMESVLNVWIPKIRARSKSIPIILVGTQTDMRKVNKKGHIFSSEGHILSKMIGADSYIECSAKMGTGVQESFINAVTATIKHSKKKTNLLKRVLGR